MQADDTDGSLTFISELETYVSVKVNVAPPAATGAKWRKRVCGGGGGGEKTTEHHQSSASLPRSDVAISAARGCFLSPLETWVNCCVSLRSCSTRASAA